MKNFHKCGRCEVAVLKKQNDRSMKVNMLAFIVSEMKIQVTERFGAITLERNLAALRY